MHVTTQTLNYLDYHEELKFISRILDLLSRGFEADARRLLVIRHAALLAAQTPKLKRYDPREESLR